MLNIGQRLAQAIVLVVDIEAHIQVGANEERIQAGVTGEGIQAGATGELGNMVVGTCCPAGNIGVVAAAGRATAVADMVAAAMRLAEVVSKGLAGRLAAVSMVAALNLVEEGFLEHPAGHTASSLAVLASAKQAGQKPGARICSFYVLRCCMQYVVPRGKLLMFGL